MSRKGENITKRKDGRWEARYIKGRDLNEKAIYAYLYAHSYSEAREKKRLAMQESIQNISRKDCNVYTVACEFLNSKRCNVKESTFVHYSQIIEKYIRPFIGEAKVSAISSIVLESFTNQLLNNGKIGSKGGLSNKTVREILALLKQIMTYAYKKGYIGKVPAFISVPAVPKKAVKILTHKEQVALEKYTKNSDDKAFGIYLCLYTGLRLGELCALKWSDINIKDQTILISRTIQRIEDRDQMFGKKTKVIIDSPKTESSHRYVPIPNDIAQKLAERKEKICDENHFFLSGTSKYIEPRTYYKYYKKCEKDCGIGDYTFHALRHTFATRCIECGFDAKSLSEILGHSNVKITMERYTHPSMDLKRKYIECLYNSF